MKDYMTRLAQKAQPEIKKPIQCWQVKSGNIVHYESTYASLCFNYRSKHQLLNATVTAKY